MSYEIPDWNKSEVIFPPPSDMEDVAKSIYCQRECAGCAVWGANFTMLAGSFCPAVENNVCIISGGGTRVDPFAIESYCEVLKSEYLE